MQRIISAWKDNMERYQLGKIKTWKDNSFGGKPLGKITG